MKLNPNLVEQLRQSLASVPEPFLRVSDIEVYPGASPYALCPALICHVGIAGRGRPIEKILKSLRSRFPAHLPNATAPRAKGGAEAAAQVAAELAGSFLSERMGVDLASGARHTPAGAACWVEHFPLTPDGKAALLAYRTVAAMLVAINEAASPAAIRPSRAVRMLTELEQALSREVMQAQSLFLINGARRKAIPVMNVGGSPHAWQFGWGSRSQTFFVTASHEDSAAGHQCTRNKAITKVMFQQLGLPTPAWRVLSRPVDALPAAQALGWPCVVKPLDQAHGLGVTANIASPQELDAAVSLATVKSRMFMIEAHEPGHDHRLMVVEGRLAAAVRREPPVVTGDGRSSIRDLIAVLNSRRRGSPRQAGYLSPIKEDAALAATLEANGASMSTVLPAGRTLALRSVANRTTGGIAVDVTDEVHPEVRGWAEMLAACVGLRSAGIDYITTDISRSPAKAGGGFIEVNAMAGLTVLMAAGLAEEEVTSLILGTRSGRIPVTLVCGAGEGLEQVTTAMAKECGLTSAAALTTPGRAEIGPIPLPARGLDARGIVDAVLRYPSVGRLTIVWPFDRLYEFGAPVDRLERIVILGAPPAEDWLLLLRRICSDIVVAEASSAAIAAAQGLPAEEESINLHSPENLV